jgi:hypothetical protein
LKAISPNVFLEKAKGDNFFILFHNILRSILQFFNVGYHTLVPHKNVFDSVQRRHHCRACGKVLCSACCGEKFRLHYLEGGREGRVCTPCHAVLERLDRAAAQDSAAAATQQQQAARPNPANPMEYCSR